MKILLQLSALTYEIERILKKQIDIVVEKTYTKDINYDSETIKLAKNIFYNEINKEKLNVSKNNFQSYNVYKYDWRFFYGL